MYKVAIIRNNVKLQVLIVYIYFILSNCRRNIWGKVYWILT